VKDFVELANGNPTMTSLSSRPSKKKPRKLPAKQERRRHKKECTIPPRVPDAVLNRFTLGRNENEADRISSYVEWQCAKDKEHVTYLEKVMTE
jgi:hypothetical protein